MNEINVLHELYLEDLGKMVQYDPSKPPRPRVRHVGQYRRIPLTNQMDLSEYDNIWFWSDTHFNHRNVIRYCDRPYDDLKVMQDRMIENYRSVVGPTDICIWGGDVAFMGTEPTNILLREFPHDKILVVGNHDMNKKKLKQMDFNQTHLVFMIDHPVTPLIVTHYPMDNVPEPFFNVHGHTHNRNTQHDRHINISVEVIDYTPIHLDEILRIAQGRL